MPPFDMPPFDDLRVGQPVVYQPPRSKRKIRARIERFSLWRVCIRLVINGRDEFRYVKRENIRTAADIRAAHTVGSA